MQKIVKPIILWGNVQFPVTGTHLTLRAVVGVDAQNKKVHELAFQI